MSQITGPATIGPGSGTVTSITFNGGLTSTPDPVTTTGTATLDQTNLTVLDGTVYWDTGTQLLHTTATGTSGQVLTSNGVGAAPTYQTVSASGAVTTLTGNSGGAVGPNSGNINIVGSGSLTVTGNPGTNTLTISISGGGFTWNDITGVSAIMVPENGYVSDHAAVPVQLTLPSAPAFGDEVKVAGLNTGGWTILQNAGQIIRYGNQSTTTTTGTLSSTNQFDQVDLLCVVSPTTWVVRSSIGNLSIT